mmetsp:Transcript_28925/g.27863  ORF Transcript_28925/g.27863 Transcript_28925/m.27863 type:complete len:147 (+) Transcript_28925:1570-2010(+)
MDIYSLLENENNTYSIYTNGGVTAIPLFKGSVRRDVLSYAIKSEKAYDQMRRDKSLNLLEFASVLVRIHDNQRSVIPRKGYYGDLSNRYLPQDKKNKYAFVDTRDRNIGVDTIRQFLPAALPPEIFKARVIQELSSIYNVDMTPGR